LACGAGLNRAKPATLAGMLDYDLDRVLPFAQRLIVGLRRADDMRAIGLRRNGALVAAAVYEGFNGQNMWVHLAGAPGGRWMTRGFLRAGFAYPFLVCGVQRLSGYVEASNRAARRLNEHLGYRVDAVLPGAAHDGGDVLIYVMWRKDCRYVDV
jgi:RimJ/RimL family protein N-acetyltransferase